MWRCSICETMNDDNAVRCVVCGTSRRESEETEKAPEMFGAAPGKAAPFPKHDERTESAFYTEAAKSRRSRKWPLILVCMFAGLAVAAAWLMFVEFRYRSAGEMYATGDFAAAQAAYAQIGWYRDSAERAEAAQNEAYIAEGLALIEEGDYSGARAVFETTGAGETYVEEICYSESEALKNAGNFAGARSALDEAVDGAKKQAALASIYYDEAVSLCEAGDYSGAQAALENAAGVEDVYGINEKLAAALAPAPTEATIKAQAEKPTEAQENTETGDDQEIQKENIYAEGMEFLSEGENVMAQLCFMQAAPCDDSAQRARAAAYTNSLSMAAGGMHCVWIEDGTVYAEGNNYFGQCNVQGWSDVIQVAAGGCHTVGLKADGTVVAVGSDDWGQCRVEKWTGIVAVAAGGYHTVGLKADGTVVAAGWDAYGQCGVRAWSDIARVAAGERHTVGVKSDGTVVAAGDNSYGQREVSQWLDVIDVACGQFHTVALKADGTLAAVGWNEYGQCDVGQIENAVYVDTGWNNTVCLTTSGETVHAGGDDNGRAHTETRESVYALCTNGACTMYFSWDNGRLLDGACYAEQLSVGAKGYDVSLLQRVLTDTGWYAGGIDGVYDDETAQAVAALQADMGREPTGAADAEFLKTIYTSR